MNNYVLVSVVGKNVNNYIKWLIKNKINTIKLRIVKHNELNIIIDYKDYEKLTKYSKTYKITIIRKYGRLRLFEIIKRNIIILCCLIFSIFFIFYLSNYIFSVDIIYNDQEIVKLVSKELTKYDIVKFKRKKSYDYLSNVKEKILKDNKNVLEWIEIEESGTKYIVRLVERKKETENIDCKYQSITSKKDATIVSINAYAGEKIRFVNEYVKAGDTIISGILTKPDGTNLYTKAKGVVFGEVWYKIDIQYPLFYQEEKLTGKSKKVLAFYFLNKEISLFPYKKYKQFKRESKALINNNFIPFKITIDKLYEVNIKEEISTYEQAIERAKEASVKKLKDSNTDIVDINDIQVLYKESGYSKINVSLFISAIEDITKITPIEKPNEENVEN